MKTEGQVKAALRALVAEWPTLSKLCSSDNENETFIDFGEKYQNWYSRAVKVVELLGSDRVAEFRSYYLIDPKRKGLRFSTYVIQDYLKGIGVGPSAGPFQDKPIFDVCEAVQVRLLCQVQILQALESRVDSVLSDVTGHLLATIEDEELTVATKLLQVNLRAAGAVAGVVLEGHLQRVAKNHDVFVTKKDPTIAELNDPLRAAGVYDMPTWRKIQLLADLRNLCDHKKDREPKRAEAEELIQGVSAIVKTVH